MSDINAKITPQNNAISGDVESNDSLKTYVSAQNNLLKTQITPQQNFQVTEYKINASNIRLGDLIDVNASAATDGALLVFNGNTVNFEATTEIKNENTQVNGGHY